MGLNTTGLATPGDYYLGRGKLFYATVDSSTGKPDTDGWRYLGNCPEFNMTLERETLEHESSQEGVKTVDKEVLVSLKMSISFSLDEINDQNLSLWVAGETATHTNPAIAGFSATVQSTSVLLGRWYDIVNGSGERAYDIDTAKLTLTETGTPTTLVEDTDYILDAKMGRVFLLTTATGIADGEEMDAALTADASASPVEEVRALTSTVQLSGALKFISENPTNGDKQKEWQFHTVNISANGDFGLISDDFAVMQFEGAVQSNALADSAAPYVRMRDHALS